MLQNYSGLCHCVWWAIPFAFSSPKRFHPGLMDQVQGQAEPGVWLLPRSWGLSFPTTRREHRLVLMVFPWSHKDALASCLSDKPLGILAEEWSEHCQRWSFSLLPLHGQGRVIWGKWVNSWETVQELHGEEDLFVKSCFCFSLKVSFI